MDETVIVILIMVVVIGGRGLFGRWKMARAGRWVKEAQEAIGKGDWATARARMQACVAELPSWPVARRWHGRALAETGEVQRGEEEMRMAVALEPRVGEHYLDLAFFLMRHGKADEGVAALREAIALDPGIPARLRGQEGIERLLPEAARALVLGSAGQSSGPAGQ